MKSLLLSCGLASTLIFASPSTLAGHERHQETHHYDDNARVIDVKPIYSQNRIASPYRDCGNKNHYRTDQYGRYTPAVVGGLAGGLIGNQFGNGGGKTASTIVGAAIGSTIAYQLTYDSNYNDYKSRDKHCETRYRYQNDRRIEAYLVRYRYQGRTYTTRMNHRPSKYIPINVIVRPIGRFY
jgi:uncharacterized protein YcfJ